MPTRIFAPRLAAYVLTAMALVYGALLFLLGLKAQAMRFWLYWHQGLGFTDPFCTTGYCDYDMFWLAGVFARHGQAALLYNHVRYAALAAQFLPYHSGWWPFVYPPTVLLPAWIISALPLVAGYYLFSALLVLAAIVLLRRAGVARWCIAAGLISLAAMWNLYLGQLGLICGALLVFGLSRLRTHPFPAGAALSLLAVKPQYALLVPVAVLASRNWRALAAGALGLALLFSLSFTLGGEQAFAAYLGPGRAAMRTMLEQNFAPGGYQAMGTSVFWMLHSLHASNAAAYAGQGIVSIACAALVWRQWEAGNTPLAATVFCTLLTSPYGFIDDLAIYAVLLPTLARRDTPWRNAALSWLWLAPAFVPQFVSAYGFLPTPLLLLAALGLSLAQQEQPLFAKQIRQPA